MVKKTLFYQRLIEQIRLSNTSVNCIERELGYARNTLHNYKLGGSPSGERLIELANYFNIAPEYLIGKDIRNRKTVESIFTQLTFSQKKEMLFFCQEWFCNQIHIP